MTDQPIVMQLPLWESRATWSKTSEKAPDLHTLWQHPDLLPSSVLTSPTVMRYLELFGALRWAEFPERELQRHWRYRPIPYAAFAAAELVRLNEGLRSTGDLRRYLGEHPGFLWLFGFPLAPAPETPLSFNPEASLPTQRHLTQMLRHLPNHALQFLLADSVQVIRRELALRGAQACGDCNSLDTKHILAWVKENNPKTYVAERFNPSHQPVGDPDCRLGCKRRHPRPLESATPKDKPIPAQQMQVGEYYWGYASGVVIAAVPPWGEFVLAELTQPFDRGDLAYFFPLMCQVEERLGYRPHYGLFDAGFDAWYVYAYFYRENDPTSGYAAVPFSEKGGYKVHGRQFAPDGRPVCQAGLPMALQFTFWDRTKALLEHERGKYVCPLLFPQSTGQTCPIQHQQWKKGGCTATMPTSIGTRLRYTLDRESPDYKQRYRQRSAVERINSQAVALGIERPHWRNGQAIANQNTLIYLLINLRFLQRLREEWPIRT